MAKKRKEAREKAQESKPDKKKGKPLPEEEEAYDEYLAQDINIIQHYHLYYPMLERLYPQDHIRLHAYPDNFQNLVSVIVLFIIDPILRVMVLDAQEILRPTSQELEFPNFERRPQPLLQLRRWICLVRWLLLPWWIVS